MSITRRTWTDDDGSGTTGTILDNAELQRVYDDVDARWSIYSTTSTGTQNDFSITSGGVEADILRCNNVSDLTIQGIVAPASPAKPGKRLTIVSVGVGNVYLAHENTGSTAGYRLINMATTGNTPLVAAKGWAELVYDNIHGRWRLVAHEMGGSLTATFAAGNFTSSPGTWTVESGDRNVSNWTLRGRMVEYVFQISDAAAASSPTQLRIGNAEFGGFTAAGTRFGNVAYAVNNTSTVVSAYWNTSGSTYLSIEHGGGLAWTLGTYVYGSARFMVT